MYWFGVRLKIKYNLYGYLARFFARIVICFAQKGEMIAINLCVSECLNLHADQPWHTAPGRPILTWPLHILGHSSTKLSTLTTRFFMSNSTKIDVIILKYAM